MSLGKFILATIRHDHVPPRPPLCSLVDWKMAMAAYCHFLCLSLAWPRPIVPISRSLWKPGRYLVRWHK